MSDGERTCPNCGAPIVGFECPYCGATFYDFASLSFDKPVFIRYRNTDGQVLLLKTYLTNMNYEVSAREATCLHTGFDVIAVQQQPEITLSADFVSKGEYDKWQ